MTRLRLPALLLLAALPGAVWAACNPIGTEDCCTKVVDEVCDEVQWPKPETITPVKLQNGGARFDLVGLPTDCRFRGYRLETWAARDSETTCPDDRQVPFYDTVQSVVTWKISKNGTTLSSGIGMSATCLEAVNGDVKCEFTVRSYAGVCLDHTDVFETTVCFDEHPSPHLTLESPTVIPRHSTNPSERPTESCSLSIDRVCAVPVPVDLICTRVRFEKTQEHSLTLVFPPGVTTLFFVISGEDYSEMMNDGKITATVHADFGGDSVTNDVTVVWVEPLDIQTKQNDPLAQDNDAPWKPHPPLLGLHTVVIQSGFTTFTTNVSYVVQIRGKVHPSDFSEYAFFTRDCVDSWSFDLEPSGECQTNQNYQAEPRGTPLSQDDPSPEFSSFSTSDNGYVYDCDTPGIPWPHIFSKPSGTKFYRGFNFIENVYVFVNGKEVRASNDLLWHVRLALQSQAIPQENGGRKWSIRKLADYGNEAGAGHVNVQGGGAQ